MYGTATRRSREQHIAEKDRDLLGYICETVCEKIKRRKPVYEKMIMDFSVLIARMIRTGDHSSLPSAFDKLADSIEEYWFYSAYEEEDKELLFSYIRIYQDISLFKAYIETDRYENDIQSASIRYKDYYKLFQAIYDNPELTHGKLGKILDLSASNLSQRISGMIEEGYIYTTRVGKYKFYSLSNKGLELLNVMTAREEEVRSRQLQPTMEEILKQLFRQPAAIEKNIFAKDSPGIRWADLLLRKDDDDGRKVEKQYIEQFTKRKSINLNSVYSENFRNYHKSIEQIEELFEDNLSEFNVPFEYSNR